MGLIELVELYLELFLVKLGLTPERIARRFTEILKFFKVFLAVFRDFLPLEEVFLKK